MVFYVVVSLVGLTLAGWVLRSPVLRAMLRGRGTDQAQFGSWQDHLDDIGLGVLEDPPPGIEARPGFFPEETVYWLPQHKAIVIGDSYIDGNVPPFELANDDPEAPARMRALLELPFELVLPTHGDVVDRAGFEATLD